MILLQTALNVNAETEFQEKCCRKPKEHHQCNIETDISSRDGKNVKIVKLLKLGKKTARFSRTTAQKPAASKKNKIAERFIADLLQEFTDDLKIIPSEQFDFRNQHSTKQQIIRIVEYAAD